MFESVKQFTDTWSREAKMTSRVILAIPDHMLGERLHPKARPVGALAWHLVTAITEITRHVGLSGLGPGNDAPVPTTSAEIADAHKKTSIALVDAVGRGWSDQTLKTIDDVYGYKWTRGRTLGVLLTHEIHHRGQLTAMLRIGGEKVPGVYGPSADESWTGS